MRWINWPYLYLKCFGKHVYEDILSQTLIKVISINLLLKAVYELYYSHNMLKSLESKNEAVAESDMFSKKNWGLKKN